MHVDPTDLLLFARVMEAGSFSGAAERAGLPKSTVSRRISALERELGERLLLRTTRKLTLTDMGHAVLLHARQVADEVDAAVSLAQHRQAEPSGRLRVSLPSDPPLRDVPGFVAAFLKRYPQVTLELDLSSRRVDVIGEGYDVALRMGSLSDDATLVARRVVEQPWGLYAAPDYLAGRRPLAHPGDLAAHEGLAMRARNGEPIPWRLSRGIEPEQWEGVPPLRMSANLPSLLMQLAVAGLGIAPAPDRDAAPLVQQSRLVRVLPEWCLPAGVGWAVTPGRRFMPKKTLVFLEMLEETLAREALEVRQALGMPRPPKRGGR